MAIDIVNISEFSHEKWWCSIVMLVYQRVCFHVSTIKNMAPWLLLYHDIYLPFGNEWNWFLQPSATCWLVLDEYFPQFLHPAMCSACRGLPTELSWPAPPDRTPHRADADGAPRFPGWKPNFPASPVGRPDSSGSWKNPSSMTNQLDFARVEYQGTPQTGLRVFRA